MLQQSGKFVIIHFGRELGGKVVGWKYTMRLGHGKGYDRRRKAYDTNIKSKLGGENITTDPGAGHPSQKSNEEELRTLALRDRPDGQIPVLLPLEPLGGDHWPASGPEGCTSRTKVRLCQAGHASIASLFVIVVEINTQHAKSNGPSRHCARFRTGAITTIPAVRH
ncbi:uncharacterized protein PHACADRAFT_206291 [Phanerochaete carnosa HHB-10118-sp]|uniref:Uncharacterized protein n=1 Tax=Phanerochaete carnosa (strain HHB-10118-sp) TaxID=650164 RepID=K5WLM5_PHACS|nr:uncharacterized protein PHACADRAFT_206291 [Phanerochaete carnosa HHB-10118-sp]EKM60094.1 hypothetical protein PHACADRAFT_206291 [Phanerochaete carnosa HHB-10118-sp]